MADGAGGLAVVQDLRFQDEAWPISFVVPADSAEEWIAQFEAECDDRHWSSAGISQLEPHQNSGSRTIATGVRGASPEVHVVWERGRNGPVIVKARSMGDPAISVDDVASFFNAIQARCDIQARSLLHRRAHLTYQGLPWRGELWLQESVRLGPPSKYPPTLLGQQIIVLDGMIEGIGWQGVNAEFSRLVREVSIFLSVLLGIHTREEHPRSAWVLMPDVADRLTSSEYMHLGYLEKEAKSGMPQRGDFREIPLVPVQRPDLQRYRYEIPDSEESAPEDIVKLWATLLNLAPGRRAQFLKAGNAYCAAQSLWPDHQTGYAAFLVVACEALKPSGRRYRDWNVFHRCGELARIRSWTAHTKSAP